MASLLPNWGFHSTVHATYAPKQVDLPLKGAASQDGTAKISLSKFVKNFVPAVADNSKFSLKPYLFNGVLQTLYVPYHDLSKEYAVYYARDIVDVTEEDAKQFKNMPTGQFTVDYVVEPKEKTPEEFKQRYAETLPEGYPRLHPRCRYYTKEEMAELYKAWDSDDKPIIIISPGLAGGINEPQIRAVCEALFKKGFKILVLNSRGCCRSKTTTPHLFSGLHTDDMRMLIRFLHRKFPQKQIHLAGFSFGGVIIANYLAQEAENSIVSSAISVSSPWNLLNSCGALNSTWVGRHMFQPSILFFLNNLMKNNMATLKQVPELFDEEEFHRIKKTFKTTEDFDDRYTAILAGFPSGATYYMASSPLMRIFKIKTPMLIINSKDDPIISTDYPYHEVEKNPYLYMATSDLGGHYSFVDSKGKFWYADVVRDFVDAFYKNIDGDKRPDDFGFNVHQRYFKDTIDLY